MLDAENNYDIEGATRVAAELAALEFRWFEAPLMDYDLPGYRALTALEQVPIIPSGNWIQDLPAFEHALASNCWTDARTDVTVCGGFTPAQKYLQQVAAAGKRCEVMSWGNTLISTANLHLMLGTGLCSYYEQPIPYEPYEYGMRDVISTAADGCVTGPTGPGLGVEVDEAAVEAQRVEPSEPALRRISTVVYSDGLRWNFADEHQRHEAFYLGDLPGFVRGIRLEIQVDDGGREFEDLYRRCAEAPVVEGE